MTKNLIVDRGELFSEIVERGRLQNAVTRESYHEMVDEVIEEHRQVAEISDHDDINDLTQDLRARFEEYIATFTEDTDANAVE